MQEPNKLFNRNFALQWQGQTVSRLGSQVFMAGLLFWIKHATGSASLMGALSVVASVPSILLMPVGGALADRFPRRTIIIVGDLIRAIALLSLSGLMLLRPDAIPAILVGLFVVSVINSIVGSFFGPAIAATIPDLVPKNRVTAANSLGQLSLQGALFVGQAIGGVLYRVLGAPLLFLINGVSFLYSSTSEVFVKIPQTLPESSARNGGDWRAQFREFGHTIVEGFRYVWHKPGLRQMLFLSAVLSFFTAPILLLMPFYVEDTLHARTDWYGFLLSGFAVGTVLGYAIAGMLRLRAQTRGLAMIAISVIVPIGFVGLGLAKTTGLALGMMVLGGLATGFVTVNITTLIQVTTPSEIRGRVVGLLTALSSALTPLGSGLAGIVADATGKNVPLIFITSGLITAACALLLSTNRSYRAIMATDLEQARPQRSAQPRPPKPQPPAQPDLPAA